MEWFISTCMFIGIICGILVTLHVAGSIWKASGVMGCYEYCNDFWENVGTGLTVIVCGGFIVFVFGGLGLLIINCIRMAVFG